jgi:hypothetical protein
MSDDTKGTAETPGPGTSAAPGEGDRTARSALAREIDENLKRVYQATLDEEVPERFRELLARLRDKDGRS